MSSGSSNSGSSVAGIIAAIVGLGFLATGIGFVAQWFMHGAQVPGLPPLRLPSVEWFLPAKHDDRDDQQGQQ